MRREKYNTTMIANSKEKKRNKIVVVSKYGFNLLDF